MKNVLNVLKPGEIKAIKDNYDPKTNRVYKNCIALNTTASVTLRTNGEVIYGLYTEGTKTIGFTHNPKYKEPYVQDKEYFFYKEKVLKAWRAAFNEKAQDKYYAVQAVIAKLKEVNTKPSAVQVQEPVLNTVNNKIEKEEVKDMNKKTVQEIVELNIMQMAHKLRRELKLEGHYHVQMKIAMNLAWQVKKEEITIESLNIKATDIKSEVKAVNTSVKATNTYNAEEDFEKVEKYFVDRATKMCSDNDIFPTDAGFIIMETKNMVVKAIEQQDTTNMSARDLTVAIRKDIFNKISQLVTEQVELDAIAEAKEKAAQDLAIEAQMRAEEEARRLAQQCDVVETVEPVTSVNFRFYLHSLSKGQAVFYCKDMNSGHAAPCFKMAAKHIRTLDSDFANKYLSKLLHQAPNNTVIEYYGDFTYITFMNNDSLRQLAASKNITLTLGVAPSGDVA